MLIKYYTVGLPNSLHIIEGVSNVSVPTNVYEVGERSSSDPHYTHSHEYDLNTDIGQAVKYIYFTHEGQRSRLSVLGLAYICNDDGKTIEKVSPL